MRKGALLIISAPSGAGKTTICRRLLALRKDLRASVSCTTRPPRLGEREGRSYFFLSREEFRRRIARREFLEWAVVHDAYYGTPSRFVEETLRAGRNVALTIDVKGAAAVRRRHPDAVLVFVLPPSLAALKSRLAHRRDPRAEVAKRLANSRGELAAAKDYDYVVVNDDLQKAVSQISCILTAESLRARRLDLARLAPATPRT
ncbi:MAG: guanylate kinase [Elusimicrobia bacterium]|nr:guanylate kinase [Elusimicrobiota bacterium]